MQLRKIAGPSTSDGLSSSPTVLEVTDDATAGGVTLQLADGTPLTPDMAVLVGSKLEPLDPETRAALEIPDHEDAFVLPKEILIRGVRLMDAG